jgi:uncharacterized metal-binding protein
MAQAGARKKNRATREARRVAALGGPRIVLTTGHAQEAGLVAEVPDS